MEKIFSLDDDNRSADREVTSPFMEHEGSLP
jgi:hypothetical protein